MEEVQTYFTCPILCLNVVIPVFGKVFIDTLSGYNLFEKVFIFVSFITIQKRFTVKMFFTAAWCLFMQLYCNITVLIFGKKYKCILNKIQPLL